MTNRIFQNVLYQMKDIIKTTTGVIDNSGTVIACSDPLRLGEKHEKVLNERSANEEHLVCNHISYHFFLDAKHKEYAAFVEGTQEETARYAALLAVFIHDIIKYHDEKFDCTNFIKNIVLENILPGDIYSRARELHLAIDAYRVVLLIRVVSGNDISTYDVVSRLFPEKQKDFVFNINETDTILVKELHRETAEKDISSLADSLVDTLNSEYYIKAVVGIGNPISTIKDLSTSFKEAQIALEVSKVFDTEQLVVDYKHLGIARLIYQLPTTICEMFLKEVFKQGSIDSLDEETLFTIQRFFENNLNVSETSRGLFVHRNTLVYRLEKIKKLTGLDLREFDDAIIFKVALMVKKYLNANPTKY